MGTAFFLYTCGLMGVAVMACTISVAVWLLTRRRDCLYALAGFAAYALELALVFFDEYARSKFAFPELFDEPLMHPVESAGLGIVVMGSLWLWMLWRVHAPQARGLRIVPIAVFALGSALLVPREGASSTVQQYAYWLWRDLAVMGALGFAAWWYRFRAGEHERLDMARSRAFFLVALALAGCVIAEDTYMILIYRPAYDTSLQATFLWYLSGRNISENILMIACVVQLMLRNERVLRVYASHPAVVESAEPRMEPPALELEPRLLLYADAHALSAREREVLGLLLKGMDTKRIASELVVSVGTVKAHLSRMYKKIGVHNREDLIQDFWRS